MHLDIHKNAEEDIARHIGTHLDAIAVILATLEQIEADPNVVDKLTMKGDDIFFGDQRLGIRPWESAKKVGNLWRFRAFDTPATVFRVVYGYHWQTRQIVVLAVVHKEEFNYDDHESGLANRILNDWRALF